MFIGSRRLIVGIMVAGMAGIALVTVPSVVVHSPSHTLTPDACPNDQAQAALAALPAYVPSKTVGYVHLEQGHFAVGDTTYAVQGVNYYPSRYPWRRFLTESHMEDIEPELKLLQDTGFNTLRIFLWNDALFTCPGSGVVPVGGAFERLDGVIHAASADGFRLIVTLNDMPDLADSPLYSDPLVNQQQTAFIVGRYRQEAAILAWDLRNEGDIDYGSNKGGLGEFSREAVLDWLAKTSARVRALDNIHLLTAGWLYDADLTAPYVDFVSFHHWWDGNGLRSRVDVLRSQTDKPILLEEFGYSTLNMTPDDQSRMLRGVIQAVGDEKLLGWLIWTAFDFPLDATCIRPACPSADNAEHHFGLWYADYTDKPVVQMLRGLSK